MIKRTLTAIVLSLLANANTSDGQEIKNFDIDECSQYAAKLESFLKRHPSFVVDGFPLPPSNKDFINCINNFLQKKSGKRFGIIDSDKGYPIVVEYY